MSLVITPSSTYPSEFSNRPRSDRSERTVGEALQFPLTDEEQNAVRIFEMLKKKALRTIDAYDKLLDSLRNDKDPNRDGVLGTYLALAIEVGINNLSIASDPVDFISRYEQVIDPKPEGSIGYLIDQKLLHSIKNLQKDNQPRAKWLAKQMHEYALNAGNVSLRLAIEEMYPDLKPKMPWDVN